MKNTHVTIFGIGVEHYSSDLLADLPGPRNDVANIKKILIENKATALFNKNRFIEIINPNLCELKTKINNYILGRSAKKDILIFYYSGHGIAIGRNDFGFCTTDTIISPGENAVLPLSVLKFSELVASLLIADVIPIFIIDSCYSGIANNQLRISPSDAISDLRDKTHSIFASSYALLCSCADNQASIDTLNGGLFSSCLFEVAIQGFTKKEIDKPRLTLKDIFPRIEQTILSATADNSPRLFLGPTLPEFPLLINSGYKIRSYSLSSTFIKILEALWNQGKEKELTIAEIGKIGGNSAYCNHNKLAFSPWSLIETVPGSKKKRLSARGRNFMKGQLQVPRKLMQDPKSGDIVPDPKTKKVSYLDYKKT